MLVNLILLSEYKTTKQHSLPLTVPLSSGLEEPALIGRAVEGGPSESLGRGRGRTVPPSPSVDILSSYKCHFPLRRRTRNLMI